MSDAKLSLSLAERVDVECDRFEEEWRSGRQPSIDDYLAAAPATDRSVLLSALLAVENELRFGAEASTVAKTLEDSPPGQSALIRSTVVGYEILGELGRGGMGVVYKARQGGLDRVVALKMILAGDHAGPFELARFQSEAKAIARLRHPNIVQVFEVGEHDGKPFFSMEFCEGGSLDRLLSGNPLPPEKAASLVRTLAEAMQAAHEANVVHRDLKPANVLLTGGSIGPLGPIGPIGPIGPMGPIEQQLVPKISDFGLAKRLDADAAPTRSGIVIGTPSYMAPEQARGEKDVGPAADVYALGAILYELLTGRPPFRAPTPLETVLQVISDDPVLPRLLQPRLPRDAETICLKCLQKSPVGRYASAQELADDLGRFLSGEPIRARPVGRAERLFRWCRRNPVPAVLTASLALVLVAGITGVTFFWMMARGQRDRAERNFERVFGAINESLNQVSGSPELKAQEMQSFRKRLLTAAQQQYQDFVAELKDNPRAEEALVRSWIRLAQINRDLGNKTEAADAARSSVAVCDKLVGKAPTIGNRGLLAWAWEEQMLTTTDAEAQRQATERVLELLEAIVRDDPSNEAVLFSLARTYYDMGVGHDNAGRHAEALVWVNKARDVLERNSQGGTLPLIIEEFRVQILQHLARLQPAGSGNTQALATSRQAIVLATRLVREHPRESRFVVALADALVEQNLIRHQAKLPVKECIASLVRAGSVLDEVLAANVLFGDARGRVLLTRAMVACNQGFDYQEAGQTTQACAALKQTRDLCGKLLLFYPDETQLYLWLASSCSNLALLDKEPEQAIRFLQEAIEHQRKACAREPKSAANRYALAEQYLKLAEIQRLRRRPNEAATSAQEAGQRYCDKPEGLYQVAVELARCTSCVGEGRTTLSPEQQAERQRHARHTLQALKAAITMGYRDGDALRKEPAFEPLRDREEFRQLLSSCKPAR
jgi:serine/threonine-protein kinase